MANKLISVEILPTPPIDVMCGSTKQNTFRVTQTGRNIVSLKVSQSGNKGRDSEIVKSASIKWHSLSSEQIQYWQYIAAEHEFYSRWTAFVSSFFLAVDRHGLEIAMNNKLAYNNSENRHQKQKHFENSRQRRLQYKPDPMHYLLTEAILRRYPIRHICPLIYVRLLNLDEVNNALRCRMIIRTDDLIEYEYYPTPDGDGSSGIYSRKQRARIGDEIYELFKIEINPD